MWLQNLMNAVMFVYSRVLPIVIGARIAEIFARRALVPRWTLAGAAIISVLSAFASYSLDFPKVIGEGAELNFGWRAALAEIPTSLLLAAVNAGVISAAYKLAQRPRASSR